MPAIYKRKQLLEDTEIIVSPFTLKDDRYIAELKILCESMKTVNVVPSNIILNIDGAYNEQYAIFLR